MNKILTILNTDGFIKYVDNITKDELNLFLNTYQQNYTNSYKHINLNKYIKIVGQLNKAITSKEYIQDYEKHKKLKTNLDYVKMHHSGYLDDGLGGMAKYKSTKEFEYFAKSPCNNAFHCWEIWYGKIEFEPKQDLDNWYFDLSPHGGFIYNDNLKILIKAFNYLKQENIPVKLDDYTIKEIKKFLVKYE